MVPTSLVEAGFLPTWRLLNFASNRSHPPRQFWHEEFDVEMTGSRMTARAAPAGIDELQLVDSGWLDGAHDD